MKYNVDCYVAGTFKIWKTVEVEADSEEEAEDIANEHFWISEQIIASNEDVYLDLDRQYSEFTVLKV